MSRSRWKPNFIENLNIIEESDVFIYKRSLTISQEHLGCTVKIYNGIRFYDLLIEPRMLGHKFGEFSPTRRYPKHKIKKTKHKIIKKK